MYCANERGGSAAYDWFNHGAVNRPDAAKYWAMTRPPYRTALRVATISPPRRN